MLITIYEKGDKCFCIKKKSYQPGSTNNQKITFQKLNKINSGKFRNLELTFWTFRTLKYFK